MFAIPRTVMKQFKVANAVIEGNIFFSRFFFLSVIVWIICSFEFLSSSKESQKQVTQLI